MRPDSERPACVRETDSVGNVQSWLWHVRWPACAEEPVEGVAMVGCVTGPDEHAGDVRPAQCATGSFGEHVVEIDRGAGTRQAIDNCTTAVHALSLEALETRSDRACIPNVQREQMNFGGAIVRAQLAAAYHADADPLTSRDSLVAPGDGIVICYRDSLQPSPHGGFDESGRRYRTIRRCCMSVHVNVALARQHRARLSHFA
jgi:hypothetical protein